MKNQKGFSLIELLIVVVIIGIIAAIAIPNLLAARRSANEGSAVSSLRTIHGAQATFQATTGNGNYAGGVLNPGFLASLATARLIDSNLGTGTKSGFNFTSNQAFDFAVGLNPNPASFSILAEPQNELGITATGTRNFGITTEGILNAQAISVSSDMALSGTAQTGAGVSGTSLTVMGNQ